LFENFVPRHTKIVKVISLRGENVVLEDHARYPLGESNLYCLTDSGELVWNAERPAPDAHYIRVKLEDDGARLSAYTTGRHACDLDVRTGKLLSQIEFK
jgi:hypothetical protein